MAAARSKYGRINAHLNRDYFVTDHAAGRWKERMPAGRRSVYRAFETAVTAYGFERHPKFQDADEVRVYSAISPHGTRYDAVFLVSEHHPRNAVITTYRIDSISDPEISGKLRYVGEVGGVIQE